MLSRLHAAQQAPFQRHDGQTQGQAGAESQQRRDAEGQHANACVFGRGGQKPVPRARDENRKCRERETQQFPEDTRHVTDGAWLVGQLPIGRHHLAARQLHRRVAKPGRAGLQPRRVRHGRNAQE